MTVHAVPKPPAREKKPRKPLQAKQWGVSSTPRKPLAKSGQTKAKRIKRYTAHLASAYWKTLRALIWLRDGGRCVQCGHAVTVREMQAAHRTYAHFGEEPLDDVETNCGPCNLAERATRAWYQGPIT